MSIFIVQNVHVYSTLYSVDHLIVLIHYLNLHNSYLQVKILLH